MSGPPTNGADAMSKSGIYMNGITKPSDAAALTASISSAVTDTFFTIHVINKSGKTGRVGMFLNKPDVRSNTNTFWREFEPTTADPNDLVIVWLKNGPNYYGFDTQVNNGRSLCDQIEFEWDVAK